MTVFYIGSIRGQPAAFLAASCRGSPRTALCPTTVKPHAAVSPRVSLHSSGNISWPTRPGAPPPGLPAHSRPRPSPDTIPNPAPGRSLVPRSKGKPWKIIFFNLSHCGCGRSGSFLHTYMSFSRCGLSTSGSKWQCSALSCLGLTRVVENEECCPFGASRHGFGVVSASHGFLAPELFLLVLFFVSPFPSFARFCVEQLAAEHRFTWPSRLEAFLFLNLHYFAIYLLQTAEHSESKDICGF